MKNYTIINKKLYNFNIIRYIFFCTSVNLGTNFIC